MDTSQEYKNKLESLNRTKDSWLFEQDTLKAKKIEFDALNQKLKSQENDFNQITDTIQSELQAFEKMRIEEFLDALQHWLEVLLEKENKVKIKIKNNNKIITTIKIQSLLIKIIYKSIQRCILHIIMLCNYDILNI